MPIAETEWQELESLASEVTKKNRGLGLISKSQLEKIELALETALAEHEWENILHLREIFGPLFSRDTAFGLPVLQKLDEAAIDAARRTAEYAELAHLLGARGHNLHRQGYHQQAIEAFHESRDYYNRIGDSFEAVKNYYMTSLCYRALNQPARAQQVLTEVMTYIDKDHPWRRNPLQVMAWLAQDQGDLQQAELYLREALHIKEYPERSEGFDIHSAGTLADLAEVVGLRGRVDEARDLFMQSLDILRDYQGQYNRLEARSELKLAELEIREHRFLEALRLLNQADDRIRRYGHYYDLMWRIELAKAFIYLRQFRLGFALRKLRAVLRFRRELGLPTWLLMKQLCRRLLLGLGLPR